MFGHVVFKRSQILYITVKGVITDSGLRIKMCYDLICTLITSAILVYSLINVQIKSLKSAKEMFTENKMIRHLFKINSLL